MPPDHGPHYLPFEEHTTQARTLWSTHPKGIYSNKLFTVATKATNNEAEYEAFIVGLNLAKDMGIKKLDIR